ncbi:MAG: choice-of-anchor D domain-containing protein, partial [Spirochaetes bacterium]|nr:choice-of-anchor D domain-containing protein [Spirochaetota bacterium]
ESTYTFGLTGTGIVAPEINVKQGVNDLQSGTNSYDFGSVFAGSSSSVLTFTVENLGNAALILSGTPIVAIGGTNPSMYTVVSQPESPVLPSSYTTFTIIFSPTGNGNKPATVSIANNDADENPYTFEVKGRGT